MALAEEAHFDGEPCYHVVQYYERLRLERIQLALKRKRRGAIVRKARELDITGRGKVPNPVADALRADRAAYKRGFV